MFVEQDPPMGVGHLAAALNDFDYHLQDDMAAIASQISPTGTADTRTGRPPPTVPRAPPPRTPY